MNALSPRQTAAFVNVNRTWPKVEQGELTETEVTLGDWNPYKSSSRTILAFDPEDVALVFAYRRGRILAAFDIDEDGVQWLPGYDPHRIQWSGAPSKQWSHLVGETSPITWKQGEGVALKTMSMEELILSTSGLGPGEVKPLAGASEDSSSHDVTISAGGVTLTVHPPHSAEITLPQGMGLSVRHHG